MESNLVQRVPKHRSKAKKKVCRLDSALSILICDSDGLEARKTCSSGGELSIPGQISGGHDHNENIEHISNDEATISSSCSPHFCVDQS